MFVIKGGFCKTCVSLIKAEMKITSEKTTKMMFEKDRLNSGSKKSPNVLYGLKIVRGAAFTNLRSSVALCAEGFSRFHHTALIHRVGITLNILDYPPRLI